MTGWRIKRIPGVIEQVYPNCVRIRVRLEGKERLFNVSRDSILYDDDS